MGRDMTVDLKRLEHAGDFWQRSRDQLLLKFVTEGPVIDIGCGTGVVTKPLMKKFKVYSTDFDKEACNAAKKINKNTFQADFTKPLPKTLLKKLPKFKTALMPDCIEHMDDDIGAIRNANRVLTKGGHVLVSVPYGMFFWTKNDDAREHRRRYSKAEFRRKLQSNGFEVVRFRMWGAMFLIPIIMAKIFRFRVPHEGVSESPLNTLLYYYMCLENLIPFPVGSAIFVKAKKVREL